MRKEDLCRRQKRQGSEKSVVRQERLRWPLRDTGLRACDGEQCERCGEEQVEQTGQSREQRERRERCRKLGPIVHTGDCGPGNGSHGEG